MRLNRIIQWLGFVGIIAVDRILPELTEPVRDAGRALGRLIRSFLM